MHKMLPAISVMLALTACDGAGDTSGTKAQPAEPPRETVFDPLVGTLDKAAGVEDLTMDRKEDMDAALEGAER